MVGNYSCLLLLLAIFRMPIVCGVTFYNRTAGVIKIKYNLNHTINTICINPGETELCLNHPFILVQDTGFPIGDIAAEDYTTDSIIILFDTPQTATRHTIIYSYQSLLATVRQLR